MHLNTADPKAQATVQWAWWSSIVSITASRLRCYTVLYYSAHVSSSADFLVKCEHDDVPTPWYRPSTWKRCLDLSDVPMAFRDVMDGPAHLARTVADTCASDDWFAPRRLYYWGWLSVTALKARTIIICAQMSCEIFLHHGVSVCAEMNSNLYCFVTSLCISAIMSDCCWWNVPHTVE